MTSTNFSIGFGEGSKASSKVLKPPGGGSSDLFGADNQPQTPRSMNKNRMQSNIFAVPEGQRAGNVFRQGAHRYYFLGETPRRAANGQDSHNRLFGEVDRPYTPAKNHMKSNLPIGAGGGDQPDSNGKSSVTNGHSNGHSAAKTNGHQNGNGNHANGHSNGHSNGTSSSSTNGHSNGTSSAAPSQNGSTHNFLRRLSNEDATPTDSAPYSYQNLGGQQTTAAAGLSSASLSGLLGSPARHQFYPSGEALNPTYASNINLCISDDIIISVTDHDEETAATTTTTSDASYNQHQLQLFNTTSSPKSTSSGGSTSTPRSPRFAQRNPVTGNGVEDYADKPRKPSSRRGGNPENGNPVTGEGYKSGGAAEINTTIPSLNGSGHVINKNRIPPGGFSSGLW
ncbi:microtubule-associated protein Jupiter isoform X2 [Culex pipiens pallens]|uniref:microtubule-associated protein Jupiter isoform X2 n=1 Tax=Culex pipiens pallens TaxID=42434 RepID=UPI00195328B4|nr:microtubule-associated protein Jupiter isoform X2 [Culex pipiens pallens]